jgi:Flp pilus assembly protein TadD
MMQDKPEPGLHHLREAARLDPKHFETRLNLYRALAQTGHFEEAIALCETLVQEKPDADLYNNLGALYGQQGRLDKAGEAFRSALQLDPNNSSARENNNKLRTFLENRSLNKP